MHLNHQIELLTIDGLLHLPLSQVYNALRWDF